MITNNFQCFLNAKESFSNFFKINHHQPGNFFLEDINQEIAHEVQDHFKGENIINAARIFNPSFKSTFNSEVIKFKAKHIAFLQNAMVLGLPKEIINHIFNSIPFPDLNYESFVSKVWQDLDSSTGLKLSIEKELKESTGYSDYQAFLDAKKRFSNKFKDDNYAHMPNWDFPEGKIKPKISDEVCTYFNGKSEIKPERIFNNSFEITFNSEANKFKDVRIVFLQNAKALGLPKEIIYHIFTIIPLPDLNYQSFVTKIFKDIDWMKGRNEKLVLSIEKQLEDREEQEENTKGCSIQ